MHVHELALFCGITVALANCNRTAHDNHAYDTPLSKQSGESGDIFKQASRESMSARLLECRRNLASSSQKSAAISDLYLLIKSVKKDNFDELWAILEDVPNDDGTQDSLRAEAIKRLVAITSIERSLEFMNSKFGQGVLKYQLIEHVFSVAGNPPRELLALMEGLPSAPERDAARLALQFRATREGGFSLKDFDNLTSFSNTAFDVFRGTIMHDLTSMRDRSLQVDPSKKTREILSVITALSSKGAITANQTMKLITTVSENQPFIIWEELSSGAGSDFSKLCAPIITEVVRNMAMNSPEKTLDALNASTSLPIAVYSATMEMWLGRDSIAALSWCKNNITTMKPEVGDSIESTLVRFHIGNGDLEGARQYVQKIDDSDLRRSAEGQVWSFERDALRREVHKDPAGTIQSIVTGQSKYGDYWIEEAMITWVAKDFDSAQDWYRKNWNLMPANKSQYIAAAFAKQATGQGDVATAREWAAHIQDPKTKQRIETGIAEAESKKGK
jgi:hypothetical protein